MTEEKLLDKIEQIVDKHTRNTDKKIDQLETKMELRFHTVDKELKGIKKQQDEDRNDWSEFFNEVGIFIEEVRQKIIKRIERLEDHLNISKN